MATTPSDRRTQLARRLRVDVDTATYPAVQYQQVPAIFELNPIIEPRTADDELYTDAGAMRETTTGYAWRLELKIKHSTGSDGETFDPVQAFLRTRFIGASTGYVGDHEFGVRWYDREGRDSGQEFEGRCYVKAWTRDSNASGDVEDISVILQGQGPLTEIANPAGSLVPAVTGLDPDTGAEAGGELVNIYGTHFTGATDVDFGSDAAEFTVVSDSHIVAIAPAHASGTVQVKVTTAAGASPNVAADDYEYTGS